MSRPGLTAGAILLALGSPALASAGARDTIPARYHGDWASAAERCAPGPADNENIRISARVIWEFETRWDVRSITRVGKDEIIVGGKVTHGEASYDNAKRLGLLRGGEELGIGEGEDFGVYVRCKR